MLKHPKARYPHYEVPERTAFSAAPKTGDCGKGDMAETVALISRLSAEQGIAVVDILHTHGSAFSTYEVVTDRKLPLRKFNGIAESISLELGKEARLCQTKNGTVAIEIPNTVKRNTYLGDYLGQRGLLYRKGGLVFPLGTDAEGKKVYEDLDFLAHILIAGVSASGKSVFCESLISSLIYRYSPDEVKFILIDTKRVEMSGFSELPHLMLPIATEPKEALRALSVAVGEMERRYELLCRARSRNITEYNKKAETDPDTAPLPRIVIILDELADLTAWDRNKTEELINRIASKARASGIHLVVSTQRPSVDVITGMIRANIPTRIAFRCTSAVDSRLVISTGGAEKLSARGEMLFYCYGAAERLQGVFTPFDEVKSLVSFIEEKNGKAEFSEELIAEYDKADIGFSASEGTEKSEQERVTEYLCKAIELGIERGVLTVNTVQRHLRIGFNRAANIVDKLEELGFISESYGSARPRDVLVTEEEYKEWKKKGYAGAFSDSEEPMVSADAEAVRLLLEHEGGKTFFVDEMNEFFNKEKESGKEE